MYYVTLKTGERFYLWLLLTAVKGATSFEDLRTFAGVTAPNFQQACLACGLLADDNEWHQCLTEAGVMASGYQLRLLFVTILHECNPSSPGVLWDQHKALICDDLHHTLHTHSIRVDPTKEDVFDYGLYLIDKLLSSSNMSLQNWVDMPYFQQDWGAIVGNPLIAEQQSYDVEKQVQLGAEHIHTLNPEQRAAFDQIV